MAQDHELKITIPSSLGLSDAEIAKIAEALKSSIIETIQGARAASVFAKEQEVAKDKAEEAKEKWKMQEKIKSPSP